MSDIMNECPTEYCPAVVAAADAADAAAVPPPVAKAARAAKAKASGFVSSADLAAAAAAKDAKASKALEKLLAKGAANAAAAAAKAAKSMSSQWAAAAKDEVVAEHKEAVAVAKAVPVETGEEITVEQLLAELVTPAPVAVNAIDWEAKYSSLRIKYDELKAKHVELLASAVTMPVKAEKKKGQSCRFGERTFRAQPCFKTIKTSDKEFYPGQIVYGMATQQKGPVKKCDWKFKIVAITSKKLRGGDYYHDITQVEDMVTGIKYPSSGATLDMITESYGHPSSQHVYLMTELTE